MTQSQALTQALILAIVAPSDMKSIRAIELAKQLAQGLTTQEIEQCRAKALEYVEAQ